MSKKVRCSYCGGSGTYKSSDTGSVQCPVCNGAGYKVIHGEDDEGGCAVAFITIGSSAVMAATSISYGVFQILT